MFILNTWFFIPCKVSRINLSPDQFVRLYQRYIMLSRQSSLRKYEVFLTLQSYFQENTKIFSLEETITKFSIVKNIFWGKNRKCHLVSHVSQMWDMRHCKSMSQAMTNNRHLNALTWVCCPFQWSVIQAYISAFIEDQFL